MVYVFVTTFTPGPNNVMAMTNSVRFGYRKTLGFLGGILTGFLLIMLLSGLLNVILVNLLPQMKVGLTVLGAIYMLYLAGHILFSKYEEGKDSESVTSFKAGFTLQFLNLKVILYGITVYSLFVVPAFPDALRASLFAPVLAGIGFIATSCWALGGYLFRDWLRRYSLGFNLVMAGLLIYSAITSLLHA